MRVAILGTRGIPARHGGFETFAEKLALYLVSRGWEVTVYCPAVGENKERESVWNGVRLLYLPVSRDDAFGTILFDWKSTLRASREGGTVLNLGYGTALFGFLYRLRDTFNLINMDGIEWRREKWSIAERVWLYVNERLACVLAHHLIADHPEIARHLATRVSRAKITMIPYGADPVREPDVAALAKYHLQSKEYAIVIARPDPDNSILEIVQAFSARPRGLKLAILGSYSPQTVSYHQKVIEAAGDEVVFLGGVYDKEAVEALRFHARMYIHGHRVGGTNPSLVEALAAGSPVIAHDNPFNRWVAGPGARYFSNQQECAREMDLLLESPNELTQMREASLSRHREEFHWGSVLEAYEELLGRWQKFSERNRKD